MAETKVPEVRDITRMERIGMFIFIAKFVRLLKSIL